MRSSAAVLLVAIAVAVVAAPARAQSGPDIDNRMFVACAFEANPNPSYTSNAPSCMSASASTPAGFTSTALVRSGVAFPLNVFVGNVSSTAATNVTIATTLAPQMRYLGQLHAGAAGVNCTTPATGSHGGTITCTIPTIAPNSTTDGYSGSFLIDFDPVVPDGTTVTIHSSASSSPADANPINNGAVATITAYAARNVPTLSEWMLGVLMLALMAAGVLVRR